MREVMQEMFNTKRYAFRIRNSIIICTLAFFMHMSCCASANTGQATTSVRIIYTNDTVGYLEPCSCGGRYIGGLARRATAISNLVSENPNCLIIDSGNISNTQANMSIVASLMAQMKYDAVGMGVLDVGMADEYLQSTKKHGLKVIDTASTLADSMHPYIIKSINGVRIGIVSYSALPNKVTISPEALQRFYSNYKSARESCDLLILLDQGEIVSKDWQERWGNRLGAPDIVIAGVTKRSLSQPEVIGRTHIVPTSVQGREIGVIDVEKLANSQTNILVRQITIDKSIAENEGVKRQVDGFISKPKALAAFSPANLNFGSIRKGTKKEAYVTLTRIGAEDVTISKAYSSGKHVNASEWEQSSDGGYRIKIVIDAGDTPGRVLETVSMKLGLPDEPIINLIVFGNVVDE